MSWHARIGLVLLWVASLVAVATFGRAQVLQTVPLPTPIILSGNDIGFRVEGMQGATPMGRLVVRQNGQWVVTGFSSGRATAATGQQR